MRLPGSILQGILARSALTFLRIYLGVVFLASAWPKLKHGLGPVDPVATLIAWGELLVGCCLILGLGTRLAAALAFLQALNLMLAEGSWPWTPSSSYASWAMVSLALLIGAAGRTLGLDAFLAKRWPRSPFW
jgi:uncharacterized membrane protein YphA (DoxX/SURF4 family)